MKIKRDDLWLCQDCTMLAANDDASGFEDEHRIDVCRAGLARLGRHLVPDFDSGTGDGVGEFFHHGACDCCASELAGSRHRFAVLAPEVKAVDRDVHDFLFSLRYALSDGIATIYAWDAGFQKPNHTKIDCELRWTATDWLTDVIFERGDTWCATPGCVDDNEAKALVTSLFATKPSDTDAEYFASYTSDQLDWAESYGEELDMLKSDRYCDENGNVKRGGR